MNTELNEFSLIKYIQKTQDLYLKNSDNQNNINIGIGDDGASISIPNNKECIIVTDTLNINIHFFASSNPEDIAHKALAVNLSDLAAMGASPKYYTLNLTIPELNKIWIEKFCHGLFSLAKIYKCILIGGDITKGPMSISITAIGHTNKKRQHHQIWC